MKSKKLIKKFKRRLNNIRILIKSNYNKVYNYFYYNFYHKSHYLDLRQNNKNSIDYYQYGYLDIDNKMLYACFNLLNQFVEKEIHLLYIPKNKELFNNSMSPPEYNALDLFIEIKLLHDYWNKTRQELQLKNDKIKNITLRMQNADDFLKLEQEMLIRLIKVRPSLWT